MKIQIASDLHVEFGPSINEWLIDPNTDSDVLILAGDIDVGKQTIQTLDKISKLFNNRPIIVVLGNHEFYNSNYNLLREYFQKQSSNLKRKNIHILDRNSIIIDEIKFIGATGWTDGSYMKYEGYIKYLISDIDVIGGFRAAMGGQLWGKEDIEYIRNELRKNYLGIESERKKTVVITHHAPTELSLLDKYRNNNLNTFFINDWSNIIDMYSPDIWIHGHMHDSFDYEIYNTRVICNPSGYFRRVPNLDYNNELVVEI